MTDLQQQRRLDLLVNPTETPKIECKNWLDLTDNHHKAVIAKAAIALANSEGGVIVFGVDEDKTQGGKLVCKPKPSDIQRYTTDAVSSAINKYADPNIDFELKFANHPDTNEEHAFVEILGGMKQPVFAKKTYNDVIKKQVCYVRKPGPKSEAPTSAEWRDLLNRCVLANRESMLDGIRRIMGGTDSVSTVDETNEQQLLDFMSKSKERWQERLLKFPQDHLARFEHGYRVVAFSILGSRSIDSLTDLRDLLDKVRNSYFTSYGAFSNHYAKNRDETPENDAIESWLIDPEGTKYSTFLCNFWRATPNAQFYVLDGFYEDEGSERAKPGTMFNASTFIRRFGEILIFASRVAKEFGENTEVLVGAEVTGLRGRSLTYDDTRWFQHVGGPRCNQNNFSWPPKRIAPQQLDDNLIEILHGFLHPLFEQFKFHDLKRETVSREIEILKRQGY